MGMPVERGINALHDDNIFVLVDCLSH